MRGPCWRTLSRRSECSWVTLESVGGCNPYLIVGELLVKLKLLFISLVFTMALALALAILRGLSSPSPSKKPKLVGYRHKMKQIDNNGTKTNYIKLLSLPTAHSPQPTTLRV